MKAWFQRKNAGRALPAVPLTPYDILSDEFPQRFSILF